MSYCHKGNGDNGNYVRNPLKLGKCLKSLKIGVTGYSLLFLRLQISFIHNIKINLISKLVLIITQKFTTDKRSIGHPYAAVKKLKLKVSNSSVMNGRRIITGLQI